jgi:MoaA/NifB/PqqE/SkfB family radical SAM enzyme
MSEFLCPFPWLSPCVTTDGHFRVCPVSQSALSKGIVSNDDGTKPHIEKISSIADVTNADSLKRLRKKMLQGQDVSDTCQRCISEENNGLQSRRQMELVRLPELTEKFVKQITADDGSLTENSPIATLIIRMGNKCNLVCRMCGPSSSSAWYKEWAKTRHSGFQEEEGRVSLVTNDKGQVSASPNPYTWVDNDSAMHLVEMCGSSLRRIHFSGGEPLLSSGHLEILRYLVKSGRAEKISLDYNSNMTVLSDEVLDLWTHFEEVEIGISIDGPPEVNEYIRYPIKSASLQANLKKLDNSKVRGKFWLSTTVQIYNICDLPQTESWLLAQNFKKIRPQISWHALRGPKELSIFALPLEVKQKVAKELALSPSFATLSEMIFEEDHSEHFPAFIKTTKAMDAYRRQSISQLHNLWPLLESYFS